MNLLALHQWALRLLPLRLASMTLAGLSWLVLAFLLLDETDSHALSIRLLLILSLWALLLFAFISLFKTAPPVVLPALSWHQRLLSRLQHLLYWAMAFSYLVLVAAVIGLSVKLGMLHAEVR